MKAYSIDLRERAVSCVENDECNIPAAARRYKISESSLERWLAQYRATLSCAPRLHAGGVPRALASAEAEIRAASKNAPTRPCKNCATGSPRTVRSSRARA